MTQLERELSKELQIQREVFEQKLREITREYKQNLEKVTNAYEKQMEKALSIINDQDQLLSRYEQELKNLKIELSDSSRERLRDLEIQLESLKSRLSRL